MLTNNAMKSGLPSKLSRIQLALIPADIGQDQIDLELIEAKLDWWPGAWAKETELSESTGLEGRRIRELISEHSRDVISGQKGFCHIKRARNEDAVHCVNSLRSRAKKMSERADRLQKRLHELVG